jgi:hypothetical protein
MSGEFDPRKIWRWGREVAILNDDDPGVVRTGVRGSASEYPA